MRNAFHRSLVAALLLCAGGQLCVAAVVQPGETDTVPEVLVPEQVTRSVVAPLIVSPEALRDGRFFAWDIVTSMPGIDLMQLGHPRYSQDDRAEFAMRGYDDAIWPALDSAAQAGLSHGKVFWVRFEMIVPTTSDASDMVETDLHIFSQGAMEIYLNGRLVDRIGSLPTPGISGSYQTASFNPRRTVRLHFLRDGRPEIISIRSVYAPSRDVDQGGFDQLKFDLSSPAVTENISELEGNVLLLYGMFTGINLLIMLLALAILSWGGRDKGWPQLAMFSFGMALVAITNTVMKVATGLSLAAMEQSGYINNIAYPISILFLVLVLRAMFGDADRRGTWFFIGLTAVMIGLNFLNYAFPGSPSRLVSWMTVVYFFEVVRQAWNAVRKKVPGGWLIAVGALLFVGGVLLEQAYLYAGAEMPFMLRTFMRFTVYLSMPVSIVAYMAVRSVNANRMLSRQRDELDVEVNERTAELRVEKQRSDDLLHNILPEEVANELKAKGSAEAELIEHVTVLFTDFKGFTAMSEQLSPKELVRDIHECFSAFDGICGKYGIEKIKTIGDAYMAAGGLPTPNSTHATDVVRAALEMRDFIAEGKARKVAAGLPYFEIRIGVHTGPVVAGIVGVKKFQYDIWGDTVNTASRMESSGEVGQVNISESTYALVREVKEVRDEHKVQHATRQHVTHPAFTFTPRGKVQAKGKGEMEMYFVNPAGPITEE
ncbi:MAG: adenylate/guanylate cyclase domain-containing protein [Flavobacteriales bacterium]